MNQQIYIFDPTADDSLSRVRGIGRYMQMLHENFENECIFTNDLNSIPTNSTFLNPFFNVTLPPQITKRIAKRQITVIHDLIPIKYPRHFPTGIRGKINLFRNKRALVQYDRIATPSEASKNDIISLLGIAKEKITVLYPTPTKIFTQQNQNTKKPTTNDQLPTTDYCIYVGDATWNKNLVNLAKAIQLANISCVFVGKVFTYTKKILDHPWERELKEFLNITRRDPRFIFPGFIPDDVLVDLYKNAVCNLLVSHDEGFGFSYLESAALAVPSVLSDIPVLHETAVDSALFAPPDNPDIIAKRIREFQSDPQTRKRYGDAAYERSTFFTPHHFKKDLHNLCYNE